MLRRPCRLRARSCLAALLGASSSLLLVAGCGDDGGTGTGGGSTSTSVSAGPSTGQGGTGGGDNTAPSWVDAPAAAVELGQGRSAQLPLTTSDAEGDATTVSVDAPPGIEIDVLEGQLAVRAGYELEGTQTAQITLTDGRGASSVVALSIAVLPLAWSPTVSWSNADGPEAREHGSVLVDDESGSIYVMFGSGYSPYLEPLGDAWRFDVATETWSPCNLLGDVPPPGGSKRVGGRRGSGEAWLFGGYGPGNVAYGEVYHVVAEGDDLTFEEVPQVDPPGARFLHVFAYDPGSETFAMFGGASNVLEGDTWTMKLEGGAATWTRISAGGIGGTGPSKRFGAFFGMDEALGRLIVFSGQTSASLAFGEDTWVLDLRADGGPAWSKVAPESSPPGRRNGTSAWDPSGPRLFVFGGTSDGATSQPGLWAFDARPGREGWEEVDRAGQPPLRSSGFAAAIENAVWLGFGNDDTAYRDLTRLGH